jgi:hypothetical protein
MDILQPLLNVRFPASDELGAMLAVALPLVALFLRPGQTDATESIDSSTCSCCSCDHLLRIVQNRRFGETFGLHVRMHARVRDLYKRFLIAGANHPKGLDYVRQHAKRAFFQNAELTDEVAIKRAVAKGRYWVREIYATQTIHKYRAMLHRYPGDADRR